MQILKETDQSVLWLLDTNEAAVRNLRNEARARGVDPGRLIFAPRTRVEDHLARQHFADLFLDTLPYNAHTTTAEALWVGLPVLTCRGDAFAGRVAASLLNAVGLNELITSSLQEYKTLALKLARDPAMLADIKSGLARHRDTLPLFDSARLVRHLESAYTTMWEIWQRGETPRSFGVSPL
jgi:predicted O-linked N-acetylglucosamine transferase (SPINDLY family)